jgi:hypothetical protein
MILLTNGCSQSVPVRSKIGTDWCSIISKQMGISDITLMGPFENYFFNNNDFYLNTINKLPHDNFTFSLASSGKSNDSIYFETIETIERLMLDDKKPNLVLIQWSGPSRRLTMDLESETIFCVTPDDIIENVAIPHFEPLASELTLRYVSLLSNYLLEKNIQYKFLFYFDIDKRCLNRNILLNTSNFINFPNGLMGYMKQNNLTWDSAGHPSLKGHVYISNLFLENLHKEKNDTLI